MNEITIAMDKLAGNKKSEGRGIQSIELGFRLLYALGEEGEPMMLKDLARLAGFPPAQAHAYLVSYRKIGFVEQDPATGRYHLGHFALNLGMSAMRTTDIMILSREVIDRLSKQTALNVATVVWGSFGPTVIQVRESGRQINMNTRPGTVYSMTGTASGRVFSSYLPDKIVKDAIAQEKRENGGSGRVGRARFMSKGEIEEIRENGWGTVEDAPVPGVSAYAAPVFDHTGQLVMAITIIGQDHYLDPRARDQFIPALLEATRSLSVKLGFRLTS